VKQNSSQARSSDKPKRSQSDNLCKRLAEQYPAQFAAWLFGVSHVTVQKTELSREPIRADAVIFSHAGVETLHAEFQTTLKSDVPMPLRMLDYYVGLKRKQPGQRVRQVLLVLKPTGETIPDRYEDERTLHIYDVLRMWEQKPRELLKYDGLLPLATLCRAESGEQLLNEVAAHIKRIKLREQRRETLNFSRVLAGLRYDKDIVYRILKESDMLEESVVYQDIFQKGAQKGEQKGLQKGLQHERHLVLRQLERLLGKLPAKVQKQVDQLDFEQLAALGQALFDFTSEKELAAWLKRQTVNR
jgi:predicted transposase YdaD